MNIFALDTSNIFAPQMLDDKRVVKMVLETAQLLSNAVWINTFSFSTNNETYEYFIKNVYKPTHVRHPCTRWISNYGDVYNDIINYKWLLGYFENINLRYTNIYKKEHKCKKMYNIFNEFMMHQMDFFGIIYEKVKYEQPKEFVNCTDFKHIENVQLAYKIHLLNKFYNKDKRPVKYSLIIPSVRTLVYDKLNFKNDEFEILMQSKILPNNLIQEIFS